MNERTLIYYLGSDRADLWESVARAKAEGSAVVVSAALTLADDADLADLMPGVECTDLGSVATDPRVGGSRELAWRWFAVVGTTRQTPVGPTLAEMVKDDDGQTTWWAIDVAFQERAYLGVRFIETLDALQRREKPTRIVICGSDPHHAWQISVARRWARARNVRWIPAPSQRRPREAPATSRGRVPVPVIDRASRDRPRVVPSTVPLSQPFDALLRLVQLLLLPFGAVAATVVLLAAGVTNATTPRRIPDTSRRAIGRAVRAIILVLLIVIAVVAFVPVSLILLVVGLFWIVTVDRADRLPQTVSEILERLPSLDTRTVVRKKRSGTSASTAGQGPGRKSGGVVLVVEDIENIKRRVDSFGHRTSYNPYMEGVVTRLRERFGGTRLLHVWYGNPRRSTWRRIMLRVRRLLPGAQLWVTDEVTPALLRTADARGAAARETAGALLALTDMHRVLAYQGVSLLPVLHGSIRETFANIGSVQLYVAAYRSLIRRLRPDVVLAYNWDGVFRPLTHAALREALPLVGVQQALGPYGHGLDHRDVGYIRPGERGDGFPIPTIFAAWGTTHRANLVGYGWPNDAIRVTGYARLDPYAESMPDRKRVLRRLAVEDNEARLLIFTPVLYLGPLRMGLMRERDWIDVFDGLVQHSDADPHLYVLVKPWPGDDMGRLREIVKARGSRCVRFVPPDIDLHNADLLRVSTLVVGTFSSIMGEAVAAGCAAILMDFPAARYYFGDQHVEEFRGLARFVCSTSETLEAVAQELALGHEQREERQRAALAKVIELFGLPDGRAAERIVQTVEELLATEPSR